MAASKRALAALAAGALIVPLSPFASPAFAAHIDVRSIETACPSNQLPENRFSDVDDDSTFEDEITCIAEYEVTSGKTATTYDPSGLVTRQQMAGFIANVLREAGFELDTRDAGFTDLENVGNQGLVDSINALANAGVVVGTTPTATERKPFSPKNNVRRDQMASFIAQAQEALDRGVSTDEDFFTDDEGNVHEDNINAIASEGITTGRGGDRLYSPGTDVTREQMAAFLARKIDILVEEGLIENRFPARGTDVTINETAVDAGRPITGVVSGPNIRTVTASGACITGGTVTDNDANAQGTQFSIPTNQNATAGDCQITFTVTFNNGRQQTFTETVRINAAPQGTNTRPELVSAAITDTNTAAEAGTDGTTVTFTFDEPVIASGANGPRPGGFFLINRDGSRVAATEIVSVSGNTVTVRFGSIVNETGTTNSVTTVTVATVDFNAVTDNQGQTNPEGDAPLGTTGGGSTNQPAGLTDAPDLQSISAPRAGASAGTTAVDFTFDEAAFVVTPGNFQLVLVDGTIVNGTAQPVGTPTAGAGSTPSGGGTAGGNGTTTLTVIFTNPDGPDEGTTPGGQFDPVITAEQIARGVVLDAAVEDNTGEDNVLQAAALSNGGNTVRPDLVSIELRPNASPSAGDAVLFTFDQPVTLDNNGVAPGGVADPANFRIFKVDGTVLTGDSAVVNTANRTQVLVQFSETDATENTVGGEVLENAVFAANADGSAATTNGGLTPAPGNRNDEEGVANTSTTPGQTPGRTDAPDLTAVTISRQASDSFGNPGRFQVAFTFDEDVVVVDPAKFFLYQSNGTRFTPANCTVGGTEDTDNVVTCAAADDAASTAISTAVLGTVDDGAVANQNTGTGPGTGTGATAGTERNPEGAERTTGGSGTTQA